METEGSQGEILIPQMGEAGGQGLGRNPLQRVVAERAAGIAAGDYAALAAHHLVVVERDGALAIGAARLHPGTEQRVFASEHVITPYYFGTPGSTRRR